jgi:hypothetical protein
MVPGSGAPKLLPTFTPRGMPPTRAVPANMLPQNAGVVGTLTQSQGSFLEAPRKQMGLPNNFVAQSPAGQYFRRGPAMLSTLSGLGSFSEAQVVDTTGAISGLGQATDEFVPRVIITNAESISGLGEADEFVPRVVITRAESVDGLGVPPRGAAKQDQISKITLPSPKQIKAAKAKRGGGRVNGLGALADVKAQIKANFNIIVDIAVVPGIEAVLQLIVKSQAYQNLSANIKQVANTALTAVVGFNLTTQKLDPNGVGISFLRRQLVDTVFNNLAKATTVFDKVNGFMETAGIPLFNFPANFKKEVIKQVWVEAYGGAEALEPDPALLDRMDAELRGDNSVDKLVEKITTNASYVPTPAQPPVEAGTPTGPSLDPIKQETLATRTSFDTKTIYMVAGGVALLGVVALVALRK